METHLAAVPDTIYFHEISSGRDLEHTYGTTKVFLPTYIKIAKFKLFRWRHLRLVNKPPLIRFLKSTCQIQELAHVHSFHTVSARQLNSTAVTPFHPVPLIPNQTVCNEVTRSSALQTLCYSACHGLRLPALCGQLHQVLISRSSNYSILQEQITQPRLPGISFLYYPDTS